MSPFTDLGALPAAAETQPRSIGADPRIKQYIYSKDTVYRLDLAMKFITSIEFARGEAIDSVLMGDGELAGHPAAEAATCWR